MNYCNHACEVARSYLKSKNGEIVINSTMRHMREREETKCISDDNVLPLFIVFTD